MKTKRVSNAEGGSEKRASRELARGVRLLLSLSDSLDQSRARGISLAEAKRRLRKRLAAEGSTVPHETRKPGGRRLHVRRAKPSAKP
jgi:hypothetical protein